MLVSAHDRAIDEVDRPVQLSVAICSLLQRHLDACPDASAPPAIEVAGDDVPRAVLCWQVAPGSSRRQDPEDPIEDTSMRMRGPPDSGFLRWKQRS